MGSLHFGICGVFYLQLETRSKLSQLFYGGSMRNSIEDAPETTAISCLLQGQLNPFATLFTGRWSLKLWTIIINVCDLLNVFWTRKLQLILLSLRLSASCTSNACNISMCSFLPANVCPKTVYRILLQASMRPGMSDISPATQLPDHPNSRVPNICWPW